MASSFIFVQLHCESLLFCFMITLVVADFLLCSYWICLLACVWSHRQLCIERWMGNIERKEIKKRFKVAPTVQGKNYPWPANPICPVNHEWKWHNSPRVSHIDQIAVHPTNNRTRHSNYIRWWPMSNKPITDPFFIHHLSFDSS